MNILSRVYSRIIISEYLIISQGTKEMEEMISKELEKIYHGYQTNINLNNYINRQINIFISFLTEHQRRGAISRSITGRQIPSEIRLRSSKENREKFIELYKTLYNILYSISYSVNFCDSDFEDLILGYIHLSKINFQDEILKNLNYTLQGSISRFYLYNNESKEEIFNQENSSKIYKIKGIRRGRKEDKYAIPFKKTSPFDMIKIAMYDYEVMNKTHHLYLDTSIFLRFTKEQQNTISNYVEKRKKEHVQIFGKSTDGVYPLISKDVVKLINQMIYPELDVSKRIKKIVERCQNELFEFENKIENEGSGDLKNDSLNFTKSIVLLISSFLNACDQIRDLKYNPCEWKQEVLQVLSYIWKLLNLDVVRYFTKSNKKFNDAVEKKREELRLDVWRWKEEGENIDWFLEILKA
jgi:hypothetical protein